MYSKHDKAKLSEVFWTTLGRYISPLMGAAGRPVNWINYKTGVRYISFRMEVQEHTACIAIELRHPSVMERTLAWEQFKEVKHLLEQQTGEPWVWEEEKEDEYGHMRSRIYTTIRDVNIYDQQQWPALISFFKPRLIALDAFWEQVKYSFEI